MVRATELNSPTLLKSGSPDYLESHPALHNDENQHKPSKIRVAVASKSNGIVNQHFGHAKEFLIYEVDGTQATLMDTRPVSQYCHGGDGGPGELKQIVQILSDCTAILVAKIGPCPEERLRQAGFEVVQDYDAIETVIFNFYDRWRNQF